MASIEYPWYEIVESGSPLSQGDFFDLCPVVVPRAEIGGEGSQVVAEVIKYDVVVMSQSCDLENQNLEIVLVCPIWPLSEFQDTNDFYRSKNGKESLRKGNQPGYHLINECDLEGFEQEFRVVDFRNVYGIPYDMLVEISKERERRVRLLPPYREHLSQAFARFFMRVGLPTDIPRFD
ncbi:MAG: hypothetical protein ACOYY3_08805 [Chloroflexota bacterium]